MSNTEDIKRGMRQIETTGRDRMKKKQEIRIKKITYSPIRDYLKQIL